ncbi:hypothetical protein [Pseudomonas putida]|uniref:Uncharacterized protein n=1 Tax=Pseudomonas putida TaxID=303 RepID=A0A8I1EAZ9_PSEPU|nr:hypothetical protein [Pseudomonas putida]MBI6882331.1 hypothetical protein [Pseudomonas putida]
MTEHNPSVDPTPSTIPENIQVTVRGGFPSKEAATNLGKHIRNYLIQLGRQIDLSSLDGVTVAEDYALALQQLDRGKKTSIALAPTSDLATGIAMTPLVLRDGQVKSHIVLNAYQMMPIIDPSDKDFQHAIYVLAHECCHVEISSRFNTAFPGTLLKKGYDTLTESLKSPPMHAAWDEFAACLLSSSYGVDKTDDYENTFVLCLKQARSSAISSIKAYRLDSNVDKLLQQIYKIYGDLIKFSGYILGAMAGSGASWKDRPVLKEALEKSWYLPFYEKLDAALRAIAAEYGKWTDQSLFEAVGDILDEIVRDSGVFVTTTPGGGGRVDVPYSSETMPF